MAMAWAEIRRDGSRNMAGLFWWLADPLVNLVIYYFVFTRVFPATAPNFLAFLFLNLMVWRWLSVTVTQASASIVTSAAFLRQVYVPKAVMPLKFVATETAAFAIGMVLVFVTLVIDGQPFHGTLVLLPVLAALVLVHLFAVSVILALLAPNLPDVTQILNFALRGLAMMSGIFFEPAALGPRFERIVYLNPWACILDSFRAVVLRGEAPGSPRLAYVVVLTVVLAVFAWRLHRRLDHSITKVLR